MRIESRIKNHELGKSKKFRGFSLVEILVVITIFGIVGVIATQGLFLSLRGSRKSDTIRQVREELNYSVAIMERLLRNAEPGTIECLSTTEIEYEDRFDTSPLPTFICEDIAVGTGYIASGSARLTSENIKVTACTFTCIEDASDDTISVDIMLKGQAIDISGIGVDEAEVDTKIYIPPSY